MSIRIFSRCPKCTKPLPPKIRKGKRTGEQRATCPNCPGVEPSWVAEQTHMVADRRKRTQTTHPTRAAADRHRTLLEAADAGLDIPAEPSKEPLATSMKRWVESRTSLAPNTRDSYMRVVGLATDDRLGSKPIGAVTKADLRGLYSRWFDRYAVASVKQYAAVVAGTISEAHAEGAIRTNPSYRALEIPKDIEVAAPKQKAWTGDQARSFIDQAAGDELYPLWRLLLSTGMRRSEALAVEHSDIDLEDRSVQVRGSLVSVKRSGEVVVGRPKSGKTRMAYFDDDTADVVATHLREQRKLRLQSSVWHQGRDFAFTRGAGLPWNPPTVSMRFRALTDKLDLPAIGIHGLRHSAVTLLIESGVDMAAVRDHVGHASIETTVGTYSHRSDDGRRNVADILGRIVNDG